MTTTYHLTARQAEVLRFIFEHVEARLYQPSFVEMSAEFGWSTNGVQNHILALRRKGFISSSSTTKNRALVLTQHAREWWELVR